MTLKRQQKFYVSQNIPIPHSLSLLIVTQWQLGMTNGALFGVPIPSQHEPMGESVQRAVEQAVAESEELGISRRGKEVTPWLLSRVAELTKGISLASSKRCSDISLCLTSILGIDIALIQNTASAGELTQILPMFVGTCSCHFQLARLP
jgi:pseudouridine-5'-phosphate glycosidase/pseudouridine kinase